jgi:hypothetical protein
MRPLVPGAMSLPGPAAVRLVPEVALDDMSIEIGQCAPTARDPDPLTPTKLVAVCGDV